MKVEVIRENDLSNFEVLEELKTIHGDREQRKGSGIVAAKGFITITEDLRQYLEKTPAESQTTENIEEFMKQLNHYKLEKVEKLQILNNTPHSAVHLYGIVEECDQRFSEDEIEAILKLVETYFPAPEVEGEEEEWDEEMEEADI